MKLKAVMREGLLKEANTPSFLPYKLPNEEVGSPCKVSGNTSWSEVEGTSRKSFGFSSRRSMHSFCEYIFDLEQQHGVPVSLSYNSSSDKVSLEIPHQLLGGNHFHAFFKEVDNIYYDVIESFRNE